MVEQKREMWEEMITSIDLTHNSRKAWKTIKSIANDPTTHRPPCLVNANQVAHQLFVNGRGNMPTRPKRPILTTVEQSEQSLVYPFTEEEYMKGIACSLVKWQLEMMKETWLKGSKQVCGMTKVYLDTRRLGGEIEMWKKWLPNERYVTKPGGNLNQLKINIL